jgi:hypothetical protein
LNINPNLFRGLPSPLGYDYDLALVALAGSFSSVAANSSSAKVERKRRNLLGLYQMNNRLHYLFWKGFAAWVCNQLLAHELFVSLILGGIMSAPLKSGDHNKSTCQLCVLNQGDATSLMYKKLLAEFVGIPVGQHLGALRRASRYLMESGF